jgi:acyl-CoA synthetase (AMP-forming)/AMP-acid ligase II
VESPCGRAVDLVVRSAGDRHIMERVLWISSAAAR